MARMSGVPFLGITGNGLMSTWDIVCVHTIVGYQSGGNAAHFTTGASGIVQARDTSQRSAANLNGNWHIIAIENEDHGPEYGSWSGSNVPRFTAAQAEDIAKILVWARKVHGIPLSLVPDSKIGRRGIAYHRQGIDGNFTGPYGGRVSGGELWSSAYGKVCPGDRRIAQLINEIIPRAQALYGGAPTKGREVRLVKFSSQPEVYLTTGFEYRWVTPGELDDLIALFGPVTTIASSATLGRLDFTSGVQSALGSYEELSGGKRVGAGIYDIEHHARRPVVVGQVEGDPAVWVGDGLRRRHVTSPEQLAALLAAFGGEVVTVSDLDALGVPI